MFSLKKSVLQNELPLHELNLEHTNKTSHSYKIIYIVPTMHQAAGAVTLNKQKPLMLDISDLLHSKSAWHTAGNTEW